MKKKVYMLLLALGTILLCSCQNQPVSESKSDGQTEENSVEIDLTGNSAECTSKAVEVSEGKVRITDEGTYTLSGTLEGSVIIDASNTDKVELILKNAEINSADFAAIYVLSADKVTITTEEETQNSLSNSGEYQNIDENQVDGVVFSKADLTLKGEGILNIQASYGHGIVSKDELIFSSGTYDITVASHGITGKDCVEITGGAYSITAGKDGIHAENKDDSNLGYLHIGDGEFTINAGDDGIHSASQVMIAGGKVDITNSYEGIEGLSIDITGGDIQITASDDGMNAAGGADGSSTGGKEEDIFAVTEGAYIQITGGTVSVNASGDGLDSNGDLTISGGKTYVSGSQEGSNGAVDYNGKGTITGGIFAAAGASGMAQNFQEASTQGAILISTEQQEAQSSVVLYDSEGKELLNWQPLKAYSSVLVSCPEIKEDGTYQLSAGNSSSEITMTGLIYGTEQMQGGAMGERKAPFEGGQMPEGQPGEPPEGQDNRMPPA